MTAFEILLNSFYDTIEQNEPSSSKESKPSSSMELISLIRKYIDTSFFHGHNLRYRDKLVEIIEKSALILQQSNHEDWLKLKYAFEQNDLHFIRRDRGKAELAMLKMKLDRTF